MLILLVGLSLIITSFSSFALGIEILTLNRVLTSTPISIAESCIFEDPYSSEPSHLISRFEFEKKMNDYYDFQLEKYKGKYWLDFYYFNEDESMCVYETCSAIWVIFSADLLYDYHYERNLLFRVMYHYYES